MSGAEDNSDFLPLSAASERSASPSGTFDGSVNGDLLEALRVVCSGFPVTSVMNSDFGGEQFPADTPVTNDHLEELAPRRRLTYACNRLANE